MKSHEAGLEDSGEWVSDGEKESDANFEKSSVSRNWLSGWLQVREGILVKDSSFKGSDCHVVTHQPGSHSCQPASHALLTRRKVYLDASEVSGIAGMKDGFYVAQSDVQIGLGRQHLDLKNAR